MGSNNQKQDYNKKMLTVRLPEISQNQLDWMAKKYGTKTKVVIMALRDLYLKETGNAK